LAILINSAAVLSLSKSGSHSEQQAIDIQSMAQPDCGL
jgi:hypothetical protein